MLLFTTYRLLISVQITLLKYRGRLHGFRVKATARAGENIKMNTADQRYLLFCLVSSQSWPVDVPGLQRRRNVYIHLSASIVERGLTEQVCSSLLFDFNRFGIFMQKKTLNPLSSHLFYQFYYYQFVPVKPVNSSTSHYNQSTLPLSHCNQTIYPVVPTISSPLIPFVPV